MLTGNVQSDEIGIPHEPGEWIKFKPLAWGQLESAEQVRKGQAMRLAKDIPTAMFSKLSATPAGGEENGATPQVSRDPSDNYDKGTALKAGIASWSYEPEVSSDTIDQLDALTAAWAFLEIVSRNVRSEVEGEASPVA